MIIDVDMVAIIGFLYGWDESNLFRNESGFYEISSIDFVCKKIET